jgi:hypothetical protein
MKGIIAPFTATDCKVLNVKRSIFAAGLAMIRPRFGHDPAIVDSRSQVLRQTKDLI